jgi:hypothetical protein
MRWSLGMSPCGPTISAVRSNLRLLYPQQARRGSRRWSISVGSKSLSRSNKRIGGGDWLTSRPAVGRLSIISAVSPKRPTPIERQASKFEPEGDPRADIDSQAGLIPGSRFGFLGFGFWPGRRGVTEFGKQALDCSLQVARAGEESKMIQYSLDEARSVRADAGHSFQSRKVRIGELVRQIAERSVTR